MARRSKAVLYARVSSREQLLSASIATQIAAMRRYAIDHELDVVRVFEEKGASAKTANRPELQAMLRFLQEHRNQSDVLLCYDYSRFARNVTDHLSIRALLRSLKIRLISVTQPVSDDPMGEFMETLLASFAKLDNDQRGARSRAGMTAAVERGRWCHKAPIGYENCGKNAVPSLKIQPTIGPFVSEAFDRVANGEQAQSVFEDLRPRLLTSRKTAISKSAFFTMLRNPVYRGFLKTSLGEGLGDWAPLVEPDRWLRVQRTIGLKVGLRTGLSRKNSSKRSYERHRPGFELRGFLKCAECGRPLTGGVTKGHAYIFCTKGHVRTRTENLQLRFYSWLGEARPNSVLLAKIEQAVRKQWTKQQESLRQQVKANANHETMLRTKMKRLEDAFIYQQSISPDTYQSQRADLLDQIEQTRMQSVQAEIADINIDDVLAFARKVLSNPQLLWNIAASADKVRLQQGLFPQGLMVNRALDFSTPQTALSAMTYGVFGASGRGLASPTRLNQMDNVGGRLTSFS